MAFTCYFDATMADRLDFDRLGPIVRIVEGLLERELCLRGTLDLHPSVGYVCRLNSK